MVSPVTQGVGTASSSPHDRLWKDPQISGSARGGQGVRALVFSLFFFRCDFRHLAPHHEGCGEPSPGPVRSVSGAMTARDARCIVTLCTLQPVVVPGPENRKRPTGIAPDGPPPGGTPGRCRRGSISTPGGDGSVEIWRSVALRSPSGAGRSPRCPRLGKRVRRHPPFGSRSWRARGDPDTSPRPWARSVGGE